MIEADHIQPESLGGLTCVENIVAACGACNQRKRGLKLNDFLWTLPDPYEAEQRLNDLGKLTDRSCIVTPRNPRFWEEDEKVYYPSGGILSGRICVTTG